MEPFIILFSIISCIIIRVGISLAQSYMSSAGSHPGPSVCCAISFKSHNSNQMQNVESCSQKPKCDCKMLKVKVT